jgi:hypothetical protein
MFENPVLLLGWTICTYILVQIVLGVMDAFSVVELEVRDALIKHLDNIIHRVEVEQHGDVYYWYDQDNRTFLAQGRTTQEIINQIKTRFPDHIFYLESSNHMLCAKHNWEPVAVRLSNKS